MNDHEIEQEIQAKGLTAPRVTVADIEANIASEHYFTAADGVIGGHIGRPVAFEKSLDLLTFCVIVLRNGFTVTGESACASPENFDAELGRKIARENAVQKIWPLMGYALKERLYREARGDENQYADEQNAARLAMTVELVKILGLPNSATCEDVLNAVYDEIGSPRR